MTWLPISAQGGPTSTLPEELGALTIAPLSTGQDEPAPSADELDTWLWEQHRLEADVAAQLGFAVATVNASRRSRTLVAEFSRSKVIRSDDAMARYGVAARLVVTVVGMEADANLTLPFVAAQAQFNQLEAYGSIRVEGYVGSGAGDLFPAFSNFDVETYVKLMDALSAMRTVIGANSEHIRPTRLWVWAQSKASPVDVRLTRGVATAWALTQVKEGRHLELAITDYRDKDDEVARDVIRETYAELAGENASQTPDEEMRDRAKRLLDGYELKGSWFG